MPQPSNCVKCDKYTPFVDRAGGASLCIRCRLVWDTMEFQSLDAVNNFLIMGGYPPLIGSITTENGRFLVKYAVPSYAYPR